MIKKHNKIALFGTSADPPTLGHKAVLTGLSSLFPKVITWASSNPMKDHGISLEKRFQLLSLLVNEISNPQIEVCQHLSSPWAIETLNKATRLWPTSHLTFVIGSDLIDEMPNWRNAKEVLKKANIGIAPRIGWPIHQKKLDVLENLGGKYQLLPLEIPFSSSTTVRNNPNISNIPSSILQVLSNQNLYGLTKEQK